MCKKLKCKNKLKHHYETSGMKYYCQGCSSQIIMLWAGSEALWPVDQVMVGGFISAFSLVFVPFHFDEDFLLSALVGDSTFNYTRSR